MAKGIYNNDDKSDIDSIIIGSPDKQTVYSTKDGSIIPQHSIYLEIMLRQTKSTKQQKKKDQSPSFPIDTPEQLGSHEGAYYFTLREEEIIYEYPEIEETTTFVLTMGDCQ